MLGINQNPVTIKTMEVSIVDKVGGWVGEGARCWLAGGGWALVGAWRVLVVAAGCASLVSRSAPSDCRQGMDQEGSAQHGHTPLPQLINQWT